LPIQCGRRSRMRGSRSSCGSSSLAGLIHEHVPRHERASLEPFKE
jgi:hypothetical protein